MRSKASAPWNDTQRTTAFSYPPERILESTQGDFLNKCEGWANRALMAQRMEAREELALRRMKSQLTRLELLVLDEPGSVPASRLAAELLFDVISTAYERTSVIVTTNLPFERWSEIPGSERLTGATLDRLTHPCRILECNGESYRLEGAKGRCKGRGTRPAQASE